jgi:transmembrane sensor
VVAAAVGIATVGFYGLGAYKPLATQSFRTAVGQQATVTLPDGSVVTLNTDTVVRTRADADRRLVYLDKGQAFFRVAHDRRHPFVVAAAGRTVTALGTAFDVRVEGDTLKVVLVEGRVRVATAAPPSPGRPATPAAVRAVTQPVRSTDMEAGSQLVALGETDWRLTRTDAARVTSWTHGKIVFDDATLGDVVAELNRYSSRKIVIADPSLAGRKLSGIYKPGDIEDFARALKHTGLAELKEESSGEIQIVAMK